MSKQADNPHEPLMRRALQLARRGQGRVEPNPMVGCVLVRDGETIAEGYHQRFGGPHAEADALENCHRAGVDPAGCDVYVNLEPCVHHGKTPPCAEALVKAKVGRVFIAMVDPFPQVDGQGVACLRAAGIEVNIGVCQFDALELNEPFIKRTLTGLPWVIAKWAQTLDGRIASATGDSRWISNDKSRRFVHELRGRVDAIVVGIGTALADDPLLTARDVAVRRHARRVVVDPQLRLPLESKLVRSVSKEAPLTVAVEQGVQEQDGQRVQALRARGAELIGLPMDRSLRPLLDHLCRQYSATNVLVEGGSRLFGSLLAQSLIDQALVFVAPKLMADATAVPAVMGLTRQRLADANEMVLRQVRRMGDDVVLDYRVYG